MPASCKSIPVLTLLPSLEGSKEREINRNLLVEVSPDREDFLRTKSVSEIREALKLRLSPSNGQWLHRVKTRNNVQVKDTPPMRLSVFDAVATDPVAGYGAQEDCNDAGSSLSYAAHVSPTLSSKLNIMVATSNDGSLTTWSSRNLSTSDQLVSPRLPGPTHILVIHSAPPTLEASDCPAINATQPIHRLEISAAFSRVIEIPINDLLFVLNVPNLMLLDNAPTMSVLPRRLHKELPKVLLSVPHLETFPELVVYLHTKNQAALFRSFMPEWMRDLMHPLPTMSFMTGGAGADARNFFPKAFQFATFGMSKVKDFFGQFFSCSSLTCGSTTGLDTIGSSPTPDPSADVLTALKRRTQRSVDSIATEIALAASEFDTSDDPLISTAVLLNALRDNLDYIGFYAPELWDELLVCQRILLFAITLRAKVDINVDATY